MQDDGFDNFEPIVVVVRDTFNGVARIGSMRRTTVLLLLLVITGRGRRGLVGCGSFPFGLGRAGLLLARVGGGWTFVLDSRCFLHDLDMLLLGWWCLFSLFEVEGSLSGLLRFGHITKAGRLGLVNRVSKGIKVHVLNWMGSSVILHHSLVDALLCWICIERKGRNEEEHSH